MKRLSEKIIVTGQAEILKALRISLHQGNVVGVFAKPVRRLMHLTAVDDIFTSTVTDEPVIVLKKIDLNGDFLDDNELPLDTIERVRIFHTLYRDALHRFLSVSGDGKKAPLLRIRKRECAVDLDELRIILVNTLDSGHQVTIHYRNDEAVAATGYVRDFDNKLQKVIVTSKLNDAHLKCINIPSIDRIEFDASFNFKGLSSRVFTVSPV